jgi:putative endonuclease
VDPRRRIGQLGEDHAATMLRRRGWRIVERNARTRFGELDIVAVDGSALVFVEVKTLRAGGRVGPERPVLGIDPQKRLRLRRLARGWLAEHAPPAGCAEIRFDAIGVLVDRRGEIAATEHLPAAF